MKSKGKWDIFKFAFKVDPKDFLIMVFVGVFKCFISVLGLYLTQWLFDGVDEYSMGNTDINILTRTILYCLYLFVIASFQFFYTRYYIQFCAIPNFEKKIMCVLYNKTQKISNDELEQSEVLRIIKQANGARQALFRYAEIWINIVFAFCQTVVVALNISYFSRWYLLFLPFSFASALLNQFYNNRLWKDELKNIAQLEREQAEYEKAMFSDAAAKETRTSYAIDMIEEKWLNTRIKKENIEKTKLKKQLRFKFAIIPLDLIGKCSCFILSAILMYRNKIDFGVFTASVAAYQTIQMGVEQFLSMIGYRKQYDLMLQSFFEYMSFKERNGNEISKKYIDNIIMKNVSFYYPGQTRAALKDINMELKKGETLAVVGANGSGKSTLIKLLFGFYIPTNGKVLYSNMDTSLLDEKTLHELQSAVFQDFVKYNMSLYENICISTEGKCNLKSMDDAIQHFCKESEISADTMLGKEFGGIELSGGQWQRIACMRGFNKMCSILALDEPTSAIDPLREKEMYDEFKKNLTGKFGIIVTHRLGGVRLADKIVVLSNGRLVEEGTHDELVKNGGLYAKMWKEQAGAYMM